jgi:hypothetical protein
VVEYRALFFNPDDFRSASVGNFGAGRNRMIP